MRRNIAKISALIMAATTTMSPMMPAATTVAWADTVQTAPGEGDNNYKIVDNSVVYDYDNIDWVAKTIPVSYAVEDTEGHTYDVNTTAAAMGDAWYVPAVHGGDNAKAIFTLLDATGGVIGQSRPVEIPEGVEGYATDPHTYELVKKNIVNATHVENGSYEEWNHCTTCGEDVLVDEDCVIPATGKHQWTTKFDSFDNIKLDKDGNAILDENGRPQADDKTKNASYDIFEVCEEDGVEKPESRKKIVIPVSEGKEQWVATAVEGTFGKNHPFYTLNGTNTRFVTDTKQWYFYQDYYMNGKAEDGIWLNDCTKDGTYTLIHLNTVLNNGNPDLTSLDRNNVLGTDTITIPAHHYWGLTQLATSLEKDENGNLVPVIDPKANLEKDENGNIKVQLDEEGNVVTAYNTHCTDPVTFVLYHVCENCEEVEAVETVTLPGTGNHQLLNPVKNEDNPGYVAVDEHTHQYNTHRQCAMCDEWFEDGTATEEHNWAVKRENVVEPTCGHSGSYDRVVYCADCGYEASRQLITVNPTDKHTYGEMYTEWDGDAYVVGDDDEAARNIEVVAKQICTICEGQGEEDHTGVWELGTASIGNNAVSEDGELSIEVGEPTKTKFACAPATVELKAYYTGKDANGKVVEKQLVGTKTIAYYATVADYEARVQHVAGKTETVTTEDGKTYKVTYCAVCGEEISREEVEVEPDEPAKTLGQVENLKAATYGTSTIITWDALEGADGYIVVAIDEIAHGQQIGYTSTTSFVDKYAKSEDYNYYWVIPYFKNAEGKIVKGELTGYKYAIAQTEMNVVAETAENGVALTWDAVDGATSYIVKAKAASDKAATVIATVTDTEYVDVNASADEFTFYWVFPCYTNAAGKTVVGSIDASQYVYGIANAVDAE